MHYIIDNKVIKSELAAKSTKQTNSHMLQIIDELPSGLTVLDYGCGKLRYSIPLASKAKTVIAIDSSFQIEKKQIVNGMKMTIRDYDQSNLYVYDINSEIWRKHTYDLVFCINVLSAVPCDMERRNILTNAYAVLKNGGFVLIAVQYRNSYYNQYSKRSDTIRFHDGWLIKRKENMYSFYGIPSEEKVVEMCINVGFNEVNTHRLNGSYYIKAYK